jgi:hypothetical protein
MSGRRGGTHEADALWRRGIGRHFNAHITDLADEGYVFAFQDLRGKFGSEGMFVMQRPPRAAGDTKSLDEGTDTDHTIEWMLKNVPNKTALPESRRILSAFASWNPVQQWLRHLDTLRRAA